MSNEQPAVPNPWIVAVVDDDGSLCQALARLLRASRYIVHTYASAEEYLGAPNRIPCDFLVVDVQLTGMSGLDLYRRLAGLGPVPPVAFITAHDEPSIREHAWRLCCAAFLRKPFPGHRLLEAIQSAQIAAHRAPAP